MSRRPHEQSSGHAAPATSAMSGTTGDRIRAYDSVPEEMIIT